MEPYEGYKASNLKLLNGWSTLAISESEQLVGVPYTL